MLITNRKFLSSDISKLVFLGVFVFFALYLFLESAFLPIVLLIITVFLILIVKYPKYGVLLLFLTKPILDATYFYKFPFIGLNFLQISGAMFPIITLFIVYFLKIPFSRFKLNVIIILTISSTLISYFIFMIDSLSIGGAKFVNSMVNGLTLFLQFLNGYSAYVLLPYFFSDTKERKNLFLVLVIAGIFPLITGYLQVIGIFQGRTLFTTKGLIRLSGLYHDSTNMRFYSIQSIVAIYIFSGMLIQSNRRLLLLKFLLILLIPFFLYLIYLSYSKSVIFIIISWLLIFIIIKKQYILGTLVLIFTFSIYLLNPDVNDEINKLFYKEIMYVEGEMPESLEYTLLGGRFYRWEKFIDRFYDADFMQQLFGYQFFAGAPVHNDFLRILISTGILGVSFYSMFILGIAFLIVQSYYQYKDNLAIGAILLFSAYIIDSLGLTPSIYTGYSWVVFGVISLSINRNIIPEKKE